jgi:excisionase family DNA binding protein
MARQSISVVPGKLKICPELAKQFGVDEPLEAKRTISPNEAAKLLGITGESVKQWVYHGRLPAIKLSNGYWRIRVADLSQYLENRLSRPKHTVLLSHSDATTLDMLVKTIEEMGQTALIANSDIDALLKLRNERPSVTILDLSHPSG